MESEEKGLSGREKTRSSSNLLEKLAEQLHSSNASIRRQAAFSLSWMQEDGLEILKGILFGGVPSRTKNAAAYGLRNMRGRMKKMAIDVFTQGLQHRDAATRGVCTNALVLMGERTAGPPSSGAGAKPRIEEIPRKRKRHRRITLDPAGGRRPVGARGPSTVKKRRRSR